MNCLVVSNYFTQSATGVFELNLFIFFPSFFILQRSRFPDFPLMQTCDAFFIPSTGVKRKKTQIRVCQYIKSGTMKIVTIERMGTSKNTFTQETFTNMISSILVVSSSFQFLNGALKALYFCSFSQLFSSLFLVVKSLR